MFEGEGPELDPQLEALLDPALEKGEPSHVLLYRIGDDGRRGVPVRIGAAREEVLEAELLTADELDASPDPRRALLRVALVMASDAALNQLDPGSSRQWFVRVVASGGAYLGSATFRVTRAAESLAVPVPPIDPRAEGERFDDELERRQVLWVQRQLDVLHQSDAYLDRKYQRLLDYYERFENIHTERERRLLAQHDATQKSLDRALDRVLELRVKEIEQREASLAVEGKATEADAETEKWGTIKDLGEQFMSAMELAHLADKGIPPQLVPLLKDPKLRELIASGKVARFLAQGPEAVGMLEAALDAALEDAPGTPGGAT